MAITHLPKTVAQVAGRGQAVIIIKQGARTFKTKQAQELYLRSTAIRLSLEADRMKEQRKGIV